MNISPAPVQMGREQLEVVVQLMALISVPVATLATIYQTTNVGNAKVRLSIITHATPALTSSLKLKI